MSEVHYDRTRDMDHAIVASENFILATRDTGYRSLAAAVAEIVDNSLQANATHVRIFVRDEPKGEERSITIAILDDGHGMSPSVLQAALQFGGSNRFGERTGLGRFGMGLPNSSVSQSRRFDVYSWQTNSSVQSSYLDVDEVASGRLRSIPVPRERILPDWAMAHAAPSGTLVVWTRCDRISYIRISTIANKLRESLARWYRFVLWSGIRITVNDVVLSPSDPLFVSKASPIHGAVLFGSPLTYEFKAPLGGTATVEVRFSELPVASWREWSTKEKRRAGIVGGAGVSIVRAGREVDHGWYFTGGKRRENYDDWWRCEVRFSPALDELFGVTHSKQGITPSPELRSVIEPDIESVARTLNARVRAAFEGERRIPSEAIQSALASDQFLPIPPRARRRVSATGMSYRIQTVALPSSDFYRAQLVKGAVVLTLNRDHPFFKLVYAQLLEGDSTERFNLECLLLGIARAELEAATPQERETIDRVRRSWGDAIAAFLEQ
jgi:hypothetical protein